MTTRLLALSALALAVSGCGRLGDLQQPPPLYGERARADYEASLREAADETSPAENERRDVAAPPTPNEETRPVRAGEFGTPAAPVNIPPAPVAPPAPVPATPGPTPAPGAATSGG